MDSWRKVARVVCPVTAFLVSCHFTVHLSTYPSYTYLAVRQCLWARIHPFRLALASGVGDIGARFEMMKLMKYWNAS